MGVKIYRLHLTSSHDVTLPHCATLCLSMSNVCPSVGNFLETIRQKPNQTIRTPQDLRMENARLQQQLSKAGVESWVTWVRH